MKDSVTTKFAAEINSIFIAAEKRMARLSDADHGNLRRLNCVHKRNHQKRHGENKERSYIDRLKAAKSKRCAQTYLSARAKFLLAARNYWQANGEHP